VKGNIIHATAPYLQVASLVQRRVNQRQQFLVQNVRTIIRWIQSIFTRNVLVVIAVQELELIFLGFSGFKSSLDFYTPTYIQLLFTLFVVILGKTKREMKNIKFE
jgi:hypothetical protein